MLSRYVKCEDGKLIKIIFTNRLKYKIEKVKSDLDTLESARKYFLEVVAEDKDDKHGFVHTLSKNLPLIFAMQLIESKNPAHIDPVELLDFDIPFPIELSWTAPIRTKPQRIYYGLKKEFTPEGDGYHVS